MPERKTFLFHDSFNNNFSFIHNVTCTVLMSAFFLSLFFICCFSIFFFRRCRDKFKPNCNRTRFVWQLYDFLQLNLWIGKIIAWKRCGSFFFILPTLQTNDGPEIEINLTPKYNVWVSFYRSLVDNKIKLVENSGFAFMPLSNASCVRRVSFSFSLF